MCGGWVCGMRKGRPRKVKRGRVTSKDGGRRIKTTWPVQLLARTPWIRYAGDVARARDIIHPSTPSPPEAQRTAILRPIYSVGSCGMCPTPRTFSWFMRRRILSSRSVRFVKVACSKTFSIFLIATILSVFVSVAALGGG